MDKKQIKHLLHTLCLPVLLGKQKQLVPRKCVAHLTHMLQARDSYLALLLPFSFLQKPTNFFTTIFHSLSRALLYVTLFAAVTGSAQLPAHTRSQSAILMKSHSDPGSVQHTHCIRAAYSARWGRE